MVKALDFRSLSAETKKEIFAILGLKPSEMEWLRDCGNPTALIEFPDKRRISSQQRRKIYVLINCIARWAGYTPVECEKAILKHVFLSANMPTLADGFSLSDVTMEVAREFCTYLIDFCLLHGVPCGESMYSLCEDVPRYVWAAAVNKRCAVCGKPAELHHVDSVGMGRNRKEICHIGMKCLPLCREHHTLIHRIGKETFLQTYHLEAVRIDERIAKVYRLRGK